MNASSGKEVVVEDPWSTAYGGSAAAPFDQGQFFFLKSLEFDVKTNTGQNSIL